MLVIHVVFSYRPKVEYFLQQKIINQVESVWFFSKRIFSLLNFLDDEAERQRIQEAGGTVLIQRINGSLAVSRALGDFEYKNNSSRGPNQQLVSPEPEISHYPRNLITDSIKQDEQIAFIVLACDGIWDVVTNEELAAYILGRMRVTDNLDEICNSVLDMCLYKVR